MNGFLSDRKRTGGLKRTHLSFAFSVTPWLCGAKVLFLIYGRKCEFPYSKYCMGFIFVVTID